MDSQDAPPHGRIARRKEATRQAIIEAALRLFGQDGFELTTMEQIAEAADVAKGTLYNYFPAKELIVDAYVQQSLRAPHADRIVRLRALPDTRARLTAILRDLIRRVQGQPALFEIFLAYRIRQVVSLRPAHAEGAKSDLNALAAEIVALGQQTGELRADLPPDMLLDLFEFVFVEVAKQFYTRPETFAAEAAVAQGVALFMDGARAKG